MTDRYGVIGHPIAHSKSPVIHRLFAQQTGEDISYEAFDIEPPELDTALETLVSEGTKGLNVTVPHKNAVVALADELSERARLAGAVNTLTIGKDGEIAGDNTDGVGLIRDLRDNLKVDMAGSRVLILGAGGATRGIVPGLLRTEPKLLRIANRTVERAQELATLFANLGNVSACSFGELGGQHFGLIINATSAGLAGEVPPFPPSIITPDVVCYDLSYAMKTTPFVGWSRQHGAHNVYQGWGMLVEQAAESFLIWRGTRPDTGPVREKLP